MKLSDQFSMIRANILMMMPLPDLTQVYRMVAQKKLTKSFNSLQTRMKSWLLLQIREGSMITLLRILGTQETFGVKGLIIQLKGLIKNLAIPINVFSAKLQVTTMIDASNCLVI